MGVNPHYGGFLGDNFTPENPINIYESYEEREGWLLMMVVKRPRSSMHMRCSKYNDHSLLICYYFDKIHTKSSCVERRIKRK